MHILLIGSGGREHALADALVRSPKCTQLYISPGSDAMGDLGENVALDLKNHDSIVAFCRNKHIDFVIIGPEAPLVDGLVDHLNAHNITAFGPSKAAAQLEGSKYFTKTLCDQMNIPTAHYQKFDSLTPALAYLDQVGVPIVIKADGLAAGKGVTVAQTHDAAQNALKECFEGTYGDAGASVVIEDCLVGEEASIFALCDGTNFKLLASAQDHKRAFDGDKGPNTGGMGAYSPAPIINDVVQEEIARTIIAPTLKGMADRCTPFKGILFAGLMITQEGPKLIEYNVRFGDPECQVLMMRLKSDLLWLLMCAANGQLDECDIEWDPRPALTVVMAAKGYPGAYEKGTIIGGLKNITDPDVKIFHAGTTLKDAKVCASGGRVLNVSALGNNLHQARDKAYDAIALIDWPEGFCRKDIGWRAL